MKSQTDINAEIFERIEKLEKALLSSDSSKLVRSSKVPSLAELVRKKGLANGQQKVAAIVGYFEKIRRQEAVTQADMKAGWKEAKFDGAFAGIYSTRAERDGLISSYGAKDSYVLTQTGEAFWESIAN